MSFENCKIVKSLFFKNHTNLKIKILMNYAINNVPTYTISTTKYLMKLSVLIFSSDVLIQSNPPSYKTYSLYIAPSDCLEVLAVKNKEIAIS